MGVPAFLPFSTYFVKHKTFGSKPSQNREVTMQQDEGGRKPSTVNYPPFRLIRLLSDLESRQGRNTPFKPICDEARDEFYGRPGDYCRRCDQLKVGELRKLTPINYRILVEQKGIKPSAQTLADAKKEEEEAVSKRKAIFGDESSEEESSESEDEGTNKSKDEKTTGGTKEEKSSDKVKVEPIPVCESGIHLTKSKQQQAGSSDGSYTYRTVGSSYESPQRQPFSTPPRSSVKQPSGSKRTPSTTTSKRKNVSQCISAKLCAAPQQICSTRVIFRRTTPFLPYRELSTPQVPSPTRRGLHKQ